MLIQFTVENFLCFKNEATLSMIASKRKSKNKALDSGAVFDSFGDIKLLKCAAIYGANGSGKSSLIRAIRFMKKFVLNSSKESQVDESIDIKPFRLLDTVDKISKFIIVFEINSVLYEYSFSSGFDFIHSESLTRKLSNSKEEILFSRNNNKIDINRNFKEGKGLEEKTRKNALFVSVCANFNGEISREVLKFFHSLRIISGLSEDGFADFTIKKLEDISWNQKIKNLLKDFDLGIERIEVDSAEPNDFVEESIPDKLKDFFDAIKKLPIQSRKTLLTYHNIFDKSGDVVGEVAFNLRKDESDGTKKLISLSGPLIDVLENSYTLIIDEFDVSLHPIITRSIVKAFNSSDRNPNSAQLIIATHDTNLLDRDLVRRDQVWFTEKDYFGASHLISLVEYKVRNDASYESDYIQGKYGAIPIVGDITRILQPSVADQKIALGEDD